MYSSPLPIEPPPVPSTNPGINDIAVQEIAPHPQTTSPTPGALGVGGHPPEWQVTLEWRTDSDRSYRTRVQSK